MNISYPRLDEALDPLNLEFWMIMSCHVLVETKPGSFPRAASALSHRDISPASLNVILIHIEKNVQSSLV